VGLTISKKTLRMFQQTRVHLLGMVENMSYYVCPHCGKHDDIFGHGGAEKTAEALSIPFLGAVPLDRRVREHSDLGTPIVKAEPDHPASVAYREIAGRLAQQVSIRSFETPQVTIVEE
jgi:ATP-binding protein involved in chromosome partitioning